MNQDDKMFVGIHGLGHFSPNHASLTVNRRFKAKFVSLD